MSDFLQYEETSKLRFVKR